SPHFKVSVIGPTPSSLAAVANRRARTCINRRRTAGGKTAKAAATSGGIGDPWLISFFIGDPDALAQRNSDIVLAAGFKGEAGMRRSAYWATLAVGLLLAASPLERAIAQEETDAQIQAETQRLKYDIDAARRALQEKRKVEEEIDTLHQMIAIDDACIA